MPLLEIRNLGFNYPQQPKLFSQLNLQAEAGEIIAISGSSGSGKTTLLKLLCNIIPTVTAGEIAGSVKISEQNVQEFTLPQLAAQVSLLLQEPENQLILPLVEQELAFGPENLLIDPPEILRRITATLQLLQIENLRFASTAELSFGQKKLVAFASLITLSPDIFLLDEPAAGLSQNHLNILIEVVRKLAANGKLIIIADHLPQILEIADRTIALAENHV
ncbi:MAG: ABC transporter ATP-binding protein [Candidatus Cloacimonadales bacterium]